MHRPEHKQNQTDLGAQTFQRFLCVRRRGTVTQCQRHVTDVDQVDTSTLDRQEPLTSSELQ